MYNGVVTIAHKPSCLRDTRWFMCNNNCSCKHKVTAEKTSDSDLSCISRASLPDPVHLHTLVLNKLTKNYGYWKSEINVLGTEDRLHITTEE